MNRESIETNKKLPEPSGSFVRWQKITIDQLTYAINLIHISAVGTLGFGMSFLHKNHQKLNGVNHCLFLFGTALLMVSVAFGIWCVINRLWDFRETKSAARLREEGKPDSEIDPHRTLYKKLGKRTWHLFYSQIAAFGFGILLYVLCMLFTGNI